MARSPLVARHSALNGIAMPSQSSQDGDGVHAGSAKSHSTPSRMTLQPRPSARPSLLVQKLAQRRELTSSPAVRPSKQTDAVAVADLPTPPATRSPRHTPGARRIAQSPRDRADPPSPSPRRRAAHAVADDGSMSLDNSLSSEANSSSSSSSSSMRRSGRTKKQANTKGLPPPLAPISHNVADVSSVRRGAKRKTHGDDRSGQQAETAPSSTATSTSPSKRRATSAASKNRSSAAAPRPRTSCSQPILTPPPSSRSSADPPRPRASSTQPYATPQQHRHRIFDVTKRRAVAATTGTKRGVWLRMSTEPDVRFANTPIALRPDSPTDDPLLLKPTPKELEAERAKRQRQLQSLVDAENDRQADDTFADVRARISGDGNVDASTTMDHNPLPSLGTEMAARAAGETHLQQQSFAETGIDDVPEEDEDEEDDGRRGGDDSGERHAGSEHLRGYADDDGGDGVDFGTVDDDQGDMGAAYAFDATGDVSDEDNGGDVGGGGDVDAQPHRSDGDEGVVDAADVMDDSDERVPGDDDNEGPVRGHSAQPTAADDAAEESLDRVFERSLSLEDADQQREQVLALSALDNDKDDGRDLARDLEEGTRSRRSLEDATAPRRSPTHSPEVDDPLADSASFLLEEQLRSHRGREDSEESWEGGDEDDAVGEKENREPDLPLGRSILRRNDTQDGQPEDNPLPRDPVDSHLSRDGGSPLQPHMHSSPARAQHGQPVDSPLLGDRNTSQRLPLNPSPFLRAKDEYADEHLDLSPNLARAHPTSTRRDSISSRSSYALSPIADRAAAFAESPASAATPERTHTHAHSLRADSLLDEMYSESGRDMSPFVDYRTERLQSSTPRQQSSTPLPRRHASPASKSYSTLEPNSTRLAMHSLARSTSVVEVLSTDAAAAARAAALLRVHHGWIHEGHLVSTDGGDGDDEDAEVTAFRGNVLGHAAHDDDAALSDILRHAEDQLRANLQRDAVSSQRHSTTPAGAQRFSTAAPTPLAPGAYTFSPAQPTRLHAIEAPSVSSAVPSTTSSSSSTSPQLCLADEARTDPSVFSRSAWKHLDRSFRKVVRAEARGGQEFVKPGLLEKRKVVAYLDVNAVVDHFVRTHGLGDVHLAQRWSRANLCKSVRALQRTFFQRFAREYPGCLTPGEAALANDERGDAELNASRAAADVWTRSHAVDDRGDSASVASHTASPVDATVVAPSSLERQPMTSTPLISREKRMRRLDVYIPSPVRLPAEHEGGGGGAEDVHEGNAVSEDSQEDDGDDDDDDDDDDNDADHEVEVTPTVPRDRAASVFSEVGSALKRRLSQVFGRGAEPALVEPTAILTPSRSPSPSEPVRGGADEDVGAVLPQDLSNATTVLSAEDDGGAREMDGSDERMDVVVDENDPPPQPATSAVDPPYESSLYPVLPAARNLSLQAVLPVSRSRQSVDPVAAAAARRQMQDFRDQSLQIRRRATGRVDVDNSEADEADESMASPESPILAQSAAVRPLQPQPASGSRDTAARANRPRSSLLVAKLSERRAKADQTAPPSLLPRRVQELSGRRSVAASTLSPLAKRKAEELAFRRRQRRATLRGDDDTAGDFTDADMSEDIEDSIRGR